MSLMQGKFREGDRGRVVIDGELHTARVRLVAGMWHALLFDDPKAQTSTPYVERDLARVEHYA